MNLDCLVQVFVGFELVCYKTMVDSLFAFSLETLSQQKQGGFMCLLCIQLING
jgi:hypothetical protein